MALWNLDDAVRRGTPMSRLSEREDVSRNWAGVGTTWTQLNSGFGSPHAFNRCELLDATVDIVLGAAVAVGIYAGRKVGGENFAMRHLSGEWSVTKGRPNSLPALDGGGCACDKAAKNFSFISMKLHDIRRRLRLRTWCQWSVSRGLQVLLSSSA